MKKPLNRLGSQSGTCIGRQVALSVKLDLSLSYRKLSLSPLSFLKHFTLLTYPSLG